MTGYYLSYVRVDQVELGVYRRSIFIPDPLFDSIHLKVVRHKDTAA
jgi:hypothetical protein